MSRKRGRRAGRAAHNRIGYAKKGGPSFFIVSLRARGTISQVALEEGGRDDFVAERREGGRSGNGHDLNLDSAHPTAHNTQQYNSPTHCSLFPPTRSPPPQRPLEQKSGVGGAENKRAMALETREPS